MAEITASSGEQAKGLDQVNSAINQMDQATQQNAAMVEESTAASHKLTEETEELAQLVGRFNVGGEAQSALSSSRHAPAARQRPRLAQKVAARRSGALRFVTTQK